MWISKYLILILLCIVPFESVLTAAVPSNADVERELLKLIEKKEFRQYMQKSEKQEKNIINISEWFNKKFNVDINKWISDSVVTFLQFLHTIRYGILAVISFVIALLILISVKNIFVYTRHGGAKSLYLKGNSAAKKVDERIDHYNGALRLYREGKINQAIIALQKAVIEYLVDQHFLNTNEYYTNNMIKQKVRKVKTIYDSFVLVSAKAEQAGFSGHFLTEDDYNSAHNCYNIIVSRER